jgi:hypothetical protein
MPLYLKYFVLKPGGTSPHAMASREAMFRYAECIEDHDPELAQQLCDWADMEVHQPEETTDADGPYFLP